MRWRKSGPARPRRQAKPPPAAERQPAERQWPVWRHYIVVVLFLASCLGLVARAAYLATTERDFLRDQGEARSVRVVDIPVHRGMIFDRHGEPLAVSAPMRTLWVDPQQAALTAADLARLGNALGVAPQTLQRRLDAGGRRFAYLARRVPPDVARRVAELNIKGVRQDRSYHRFYPAGETLAHIVGRTNIDDVGQEGIELVLDDALTGKPGKKRILRDRTGRPVKNLDYLRAPKRGQDVYLSLDLRLQFLAYRELKAAVQHHGASSGSLVMLDVASGEVLALANQPSFNPNNWLQRNDAGVRNRAITDLYEPGSTVKPFTVLAALEGEHYAADTEVDTAPGYFHVGTKLIEDPINRGRISVARILAKSSQVGIAKMALEMPPDAVFDILQRVGFGDYTGCGLPGEAIGTLTSADLDKNLGRVTLAYGYGLTVSPIQMARAYLTLASGGVKKDLTVLLHQKTGRDQRIFARQDVAQVATMMRGVLTRDGTAPKGRPAGYTAAGKTGTVRKVTAGGYDDRSHVAYFAGFAPAERPRIVMVVVVNHPRRELIGGGEVAAPVFASVAGKALRVLGVVPDALSPSSGSDLYASAKPCARPARGARGARGEGCDANPNEPEKVAAPDRVRQGGHGAQRT